MAKQRPLPLVTARPIQTSLTRRMFPAAAFAPLAMAGSAKEATVEEFPVSQSIAGVSMRLMPGAIRELHWHALAAEWAYIIEGRCRATVIAPNGQTEIAE